MNTEIEKIIDIRQMDKIFPEDEHSNFHLLSFSHSFYNLDIYKN